MEGIRYCLCDDVKYRQGLGRRTQAVPVLVSDITIRLSKHGLLSAFFCTNESHIYRRTWQQFSEKGEECPCWSLVVRSFSWVVADVKEKDLGLPHCECSDKFLRGSTAFSLKHSSCYSCIYPLEQVCEFTYLEIK